MAVSFDPTPDVSATAGKASWIVEAQCGKLGFSIVTVNTIASAILISNLVIYGTLLGGISLACSVVILPSIALFGVRNYLSYLPKPIEMVLGFAAAWATVKVDKKTGIWEGKIADWAHFYDGKLSRGLQKFFRTEEASSIIDLGCGTGASVNDLRKANLQCDGCDGNPNTTKLGGEHCRVVDLAETNLELQTSQGEKYDWAFSLEVGEHLPKKYEETFLNNVVNSARKGIVLSWAKKGQGGLGHVNEQNNDYVETQMDRRGWVRDKQAEEKLRLQTSPHCFWFRDTVMVYRPKPPQ